jgi:hypothetical protein
MRKLKVFLLLPLLSLPPSITADLRARFGERPSRDLARGDLDRFIITLARRCLSAARRLLTHSATAPEMHVIAAAADADSKTAAPPARRRSARRITLRVLPTSPRARPQTT